MLKHLKHNFLFWNIIDNLRKCNIPHFDCILIIVFVAAAIHSSGRCFLIILGLLDHFLLYPFKDVLVDGAVVEENEIVELIRVHLREIERPDFRDVVFFIRFGIEYKSDGILNIFVALGNV